MSREAVGVRTELPEPERRALLHTVGQAYFEVFPTGTIEERLRFLAPGSYVAVTCSPSKGVDPTLELCERLIVAGFRVVPHVAAKMVRDDAHLAEILRRIEALPIDCLFVPGGDAAQPLGKFATAFELLRAIAERGHSFREIGIAAHPEGHPAVEREALMRELEKKQPYANYLVTQMCFDAGALGSWLGEIRRRGITLPAWIGLPGVGERSSLLATSLRIGVGDSLRFLRHHARLAGRLLTEKSYRPDELLRAMAPWLADPAMKVAGHHIFCFNQVESSERWRREFLAGLEAEVAVSRAASPVPDPGAESAPGESGR